MKLSVSLPDDDVEFLDAYADEQGFPSRSAVLHKAVRLLHSSQLGQAYEDAWVEWDGAGEQAAWDPTAGDGLGG